MNSYWVEITADLPYPIIKEETIKASGLAPAVSRAIRKYRLHIRKIRGKRKIDSLRIKIMKL